MTPDNDPQTAPDNEDRALAAMERSVEIVLDDVRNNRGTDRLTITQLYDKTRSALAVAFLSPDLDPGAVCHQLAGSSAMNLLAARKIVALEKELAAIKEMFNIP